MNTPASRPAVVLLSGGLDSATSLAIARHQGFDCYCLSLDYGQRHGAELAAAGRVAARLGAREHRTLRLDLANFGGSALTDEAIEVPTDGLQAGIPVTYVPARNTIMLSLALAWPRCWAAGTFSSESMPSTTPVIRIAVRSLSPHLKKWPIWRPRPLSKAPS